MTVRAHAGWLTQTDERILEILNERGPMSVSEIHVKLGDVSRAIAVSEATVEARCDRLFTHGLVDRTDGWITLTWMGENFIDGELDASRLTGAPEGIDGVTIVGMDNEYWLCPDCRWIGQRTDIDSDDDGHEICPVCGSSAEYVV